MNYAASGDLLWGNDELRRPKQSLWEYGEFGGREVEPRMEPNTGPGKGPTTVPDKGRDRRAAAQWLSTRTCVPGGWAVEPRTALVAGPQKSALVAGPQKSPWSLIPRKSAGAR